MAGYLIVPDEACDWTGNQPGSSNPTRSGLAFST